MPRIIAVTGLGFGDETKGATVDFFARQFISSLVVRYNGGAQAAHDVVTPDNVVHCFRHFGSGTFAPGSRTFLSREMFIEPRNLLTEEQHLQEMGVTDALSRLIVSPGASIITPFHKMVGQFKELSRNRKRFGSCGMGVGEAVFDRDNGTGIKISDLADVPTLRQKLKEISSRRFIEARELYHRNPNEQIQERLEYFEETADIDELIQLYLDFVTRITINDLAIQEALQTDTPIIFEGAQGALLDRNKGFPPHVSKTNCTCHNALALLSEAVSGSPISVEKVGLLRAYHHRHGAGPLPTADRELNARMTDPNNPVHPWQGTFRFGWFDQILGRYGLVINDGVDYLALNCLDQLTGIPQIKVCTSYLYQGNLKILDPYCEWRSLEKNTAQITGLRKPTSSSDQTVLTRILKKVRPATFAVLPGWNEDISAVTSWDDLPQNAKNYVKVIAEMMDVKIRLVSVNPRATGRLTVNV